MKQHSVLAGIAFLLLFKMNFVLAQVSPGPQTSTRMLTLTEAVDLGIRNSHKLKSGFAKIEEAAAAVKEAEEHKLPDFKITGGYMYLPVNPNIDLKINSGGNGGSGGGSSDMPSVHQALYGIANVSLPLYAGGKINYGINSAKYLEEASKLDVEKDKDAVGLNIVNAYVNLFKAKAAVNLVKENLQQSQQRDKDFSNMEANGLLARNDLLKAQLQTSNIELSLMDAENSWKLANVNMDLLLGLPEQTELELDSASIVPVHDLRSVSEYEQLALQQRPDLQALQYRVKAAGVGVQVAKSDKLPSLALTGGYIALDIPKLATITNAINLGLGLQYSLSSLWKTNSRVLQAKSKEIQLQESQADLSDAIRLQINEAYQAYLLSQKKIDVYNKSIDQASENYRITKNKYDNSLVTTTDLLDADVARLQAKLNYAFARADAMAAYNKLLQVVGLLNK